MKLKCLPEDFQVTELTDFACSGGTYAVYLLEKTSLGTPEAIDLLTRKWHVPRHRVNYGGLKDKHAVTRQFITVQHGQRKDLQHGSLRVSYLGQSSEPFTPQQIAGNSFRIVMRDLSSVAAKGAEIAFSEVLRDGVPNYFDDQRFGSVGHSGEFIAAPWCKGDFERALWLVLAEPHPDDRSEEKRQKQILRDTWGDFSAAKEQLERSNRRSIVTFLADRPGDFRGAFARLRVDMRSLYLAAFQSHLWNELLATQIRSIVSPEKQIDVSLRTGVVPFFAGLTEEERTAMQQTVLPLPSARLHLEPGPMLDLITTVAGRYGLEPRELRVKYPRDSFFSKGERAAVCVPKIGSIDAEDDELYPRRTKVIMQFELPRGAYATIVVKRLTDVIQAAAADSRNEGGTVSTSQPPEQAMAASADESRETFDAKLDSESHSTGEDLLS